MVWKKLFYGGYGFGGPFVGGVVGGMLGACAAWSWLNGGYGVYGYGGFLYGGFYGGGFGTPYY